MTVIQRRLLKEYDAVKENSEQIVKFQPKGDDLLQFEAQIMGPEKSPYADHIFTLDVQISKDFPLKPPKIRFVTPIYHPSIREDGFICLGLLGDKWRPNLTIVTILLQIIELMTDPSTDSPERPAIAKQLQENSQAFFNSARDHTMTHAQPKSNS